MTWKLKILSKKNSLNKDFIPLFQQIELELSRKLFKQESDVDSTERPLNFIENLTKTKIFAILLRNRADSVEKIKNVITATIKTVIRQGQN